MSYERKEVEIHVLDCPLMIEGNSPISWVTLTFCRGCDHHEGMESGVPLCSANQSENQNKEEEKMPASTYVGKKCIDCGAVIETEKAHHRTLPIEKGKMFPRLEGPLCPDCYQANPRREAEE